MNNEAQLYQMRREKKAEDKCVNVLRGRLICLSGIDGTGKTTIAMRLKEELTSSGIKCKYVWFRNARFLCLPFLAFCYLTGFAESVKLDENRRVGVYYFYKNRLIAHLWAWISTLDLLLLSLWKVHLPLKRGYTVIADRYIVDALVDLICDTKVNSLNSHPFKLMSNFLPKDTFNIILDIDEKEALRRKSDTLSLEYLEQRRKVYLKVAKELKISVINTNRSPSAIFKVFSIYLGLRRS